MKTATLVMQGDQEQLGFVRHCISGLRQDLEWKHFISYELAADDRVSLTGCLDELREAWWPVTRQLRSPIRKLDFDGFRALLEAINHLQESVAKVLGRSNLERLLNPVHDYYVCGPLPVEWLSHRGFPLSLYAPFYRFVKPQHLISPLAPLDSETKLFIAPSYSVPNLSGLNKFIAESLLWVSNDPTVTLLRGHVTAAELASYKQRKFARLLFHGHATENGLLGSDGVPIRLEEITALVQGPAFVLGCSTGAFETGRLDAWAARILFGLHGALLCAFPAPGDFTTRVNEIVAGTFRCGDARRVQDIAHMARLAITYLGLLDIVRAHAGARARNDVMLVSPFEATYDDDGYYQWGVGVNCLDREIAEMPQSDRDLVRAGASALAMGVVSCGTPAFLLPHADPLFRFAVEEFNRWDGRA